MTTRTHFRPREPNRIASVRELLCSWESSRTAHAKCFAISEAGNINFEGVLAGTYAHIFTPREPDFEASIEAGVRPVVLALVREGGLVTYTSCEGHGYASSKLSSECHVGVLPRTRGELRRAWKAFRRAVSRAGGGLSVSSLAIYPWHLYDQDVDREVPVIDLYLHRRPSVGLERYFEERSLDASQVANVLQAEFSQGGEA